MGDTNNELAEAGFVKVPAHRVIDRSTLPELRAALATSLCIDPFFNEAEKALSKLDPAWAKAAHSLRTDNLFAPKNLRKRSALQTLWLDLDVLRQRVEAGNTMTILNAVKKCAEKNLPLPEWLAAAMVSAMETIVKGGKSTNLNEIFKYEKSAEGKGNALKKSIASRDDYTLARQLWSAMQKEISDDESLTSIDAALKKVLRTKKWGVAMTKARKLVEEFDRNQAELRGRSEKEPLSKFLANRKSKQKSEAEKTKKA